MSLPRYPKYKDSGVDWLTQVPEHWSVQRLKHSVSSCRNGIWGDEAQGGPNDIACVRVADFDRQNFHVRLEASTLRSVTEKERNGRLLTRGNLLLEKSGGGETQPVGCVVLYDQDTPAVCSNFVARMELAQGMAPSFWRYVHAAAYSIRLTIGSINQTSGIQNLDQDRYFNESAAFPPDEEQVAIASFLDRETVKIDGLIAEQEKLIALLAEKRQATISHVVTKGLTPAVPIKDSGVAWLGEVPTHWDIRTIAKATTKITNGFVGPTRDILIEDGIPYVQATHIKGGCVNFGQDYFVSNDWSNAHAKSILEEGDVLIVQTGAGTGDVGLVSSKESGFNCHALIILSRDKSILHGSYLSALLQSAYGRAKLTSIQTGAMHPHLNCGEVKFVEIPIPPLEEQAEIMAFVLSETARLDALTAAATSGIALLKERRTALISAAVTGKIDVRQL